MPSCCLYEGSFSSSTMTRPSSGSGARTASRVPSMMRARPSRPASHALRRSPSARWLCARASGTPGKRSRTRDSSCGVSPISGTSISACLPRARASSIKRRYTSVLPLPVTPCSRVTAKRPNVAPIVASACCCSACSSWRCPIEWVGQCISYRLRLDCAARYPLQWRWEAGKRNLTKRRLVIRGAEGKQLHLRRLERGDVFDHAGDGAQFRGRNRALLGQRDDQPDRAFPVRKAPPPASLELAWPLPRTGSRSVARAERRAQPGRSGRDSSCLMHRAKRARAPVFTLAKRFRGTPRAVDKSVHSRFEATISRGPGDSQVAVWRRNNRFSTLLSSTCANLLRRRDKSRAGLREPLLCE